jgi:hypothetical protein
VSAANLADVKAVSSVLEPILATSVRVEKVLADGAYHGEVGTRLEAAHQYVLEITQKLGEGFVVAP